MHTVDRKQNFAFVKLYVIFHHINRTRFRSSKTFVTVSFNCGTKSTQVCVRVCSLICNLEMTALLEYLNILIFSYPINSFI